MRLGLIVGCATALVCVASAADLSVSYSTVWPEVSGSGERYAVLRVFVKNDGKDAVGTVRIVGTAQSASYPLELPKGSRKVVDVYYSGVESYGENRIRLETTAGNVEVTLNSSAPMSRERKVVGVVSETDGLLAGIRAKAGGKADLIDTTSRPDAVPTRSIGYGLLNVLFLGEGSERLSDDAVSAIKRWLMTGGTLVFPGGASAPWLRDARWADVLPVVPGSVKNLGGADGLRTIAGTGMPQPFSITEGRLKDRARLIVQEGGLPLVADSGFGLGRAVFVAFDPYSAPFATWKGRRKLVEHLVLTSPAVDVYLGQERQDIGRFGPRPMSGSADPFQAELPAWWKIVGLLFTFLAVAVPVNFLVLSRMKRKEMAWVTLPAVSLLFSGMIFGTASGLYSSTMARSTQGVLVMQDGSAEGVFVGSQKLFLPKGGRYDLGFRGVESAEAPSWRGMFGGSTIDPTKDNGLIDVGQVLAPMVEVPNLAFREYDLVQGVDLGGGIGFPHRVVRDGKAVRIDGVLNNNTGHDLLAATVWVDAGSLNVGDVKAGGSVKVTGKVDINARPQWNSGRTPPLGGRTALEAKAPTLPIGSTIGSVEPEHDGTRLLYVWGLEK